VVENVMFSLSCAIAVRQVPVFGYAECHSDSEPGEDAFADDHDWVHGCLSRQGWATGEPRLATADR
jgi:hypothetical protein